MEWKKAGALVILLLLSLFLFSCGETNSGTASSDFTRVDFQNWIKDIGGLGFLGVTKDNAFVSFMRILVGILVFTLLFEASRFLPFNPNARVAIAIIIALISVIFIPGTILAGIGAAYGTLVSFLLIGVPVVAGLYAFFMIPTTNWYLILIRIILLGILLWILLAVKKYATALIA